MSRFAGPLALATLLFSVLPLPAQEESRSLLEQQGLVKYGRRWILPSETNLAPELRQLDSLEQQLSFFQRQVSLAKDDNARQWKQKQATLAGIDRLAKHLKEHAVGSDQEKELAQEIDRLRKMATSAGDAVEPAKLAAQPNVRELLMQQAQLLATLTTRTFLLREEMVKLDQRYAQIKAKLPEAEQESMGPLEPLARRLGRLARFERLARQDRLPVFLQNGQPRVAAVLDQDNPQIFTWNPQGQEIVLTANMAQSVGVRYTPEEGAEVVLGKQKVKVRRGRIAAIRVGPVLLQDVAVSVLPPEQEYRGGFLGGKLFQHFQPGLALEELSLRFDTAAMEATADH
ncbi:retroviral-like aspartic protease family protein [Blastopirellula sp. J2-11]|uniref:retroviral-like aspartic protease family protein n=1 Tax=Blastopirellula sp. J2-11 TaxID=2943192 RepID=UPI0021CA41B2|nr:retroviral-like aspartic protease family protein [Blastopirellula sp. J2-11]UUO05871.1 retroviral-like aspartic protease family protein [Blastopirellula sp. J2-11]